MLIEIGNHPRVSLLVIFFNLPAIMPLSKYTSSANMIMAPEDYQIGIKSLNAPTMLLIGNKYEAFIAEEIKIRLPITGKPKDKSIKGFRISALYQIGKLSHS